MIFFFSTAGSAQVPGNAVSSSVLRRSTMSTTFTLLVAVIITFKVAFPYTLE